MKRVLSLCSIILLLITFTLPAFAQIEVEDEGYYQKFQGQNISINVYNWGEYISDGAEEGTINVNKEFEELTGIKVNYSTYASNEELYAKLKSGGASYDIIIPSDYMIGRMVKEDMLEPVSYTHLTSCCPSWSVMAKNNFPELAGCVSEALTPMVDTARIIKKEHPSARVVFIGPCAAKKLEASRRTVRSDVDFVITFEELMGMFVAKGIDFGSIEDEPLQDATGAGRGYAVAGGVADAIANCIKTKYPDVEVKVDRAEGLRNCKKMLQIAKAGKRNGYLLEGMACPGGCVGGAGTIIPLNKASAAIKGFQTAAGTSNAYDSKYADEKIEE